MKILGYSWPLLLALAPYAQTINPTVVGSLALLELIWLVINGPGAVYSFMSFMESRTDVAIAKSQDPPNNDDVDSACYVRRNERLIFTLQLSNFLIAVMVAFSPPPANPTTSVISIVSQIMLTAGAVLLTYTSIRNRQYRRASKVKARVVEAQNESRDKERDKERDPERDAERDVERDIPRDITRDTDRDRIRDIGRDLDRDAAQQNKTRGSR